MTRNLAEVNVVLARAYLGLTSHAQTLHACAILSGTVICTAHV